MFGLVALALQRFYSSVPKKELKRLASRGDQLASSLYAPVAYGASMRLLLWVLFCAGLSGGLLMVVLSVSPVAGFIAAVMSLAAAIVVQSLRLTVTSAQFAVQAAPALSWLLTYLHTPFDFIARTINRYRKHTTHSGLYEKEDLLDLIEQQKGQPDNRIAPNDLSLLARAATFDDRQAADVALPMSQIKLIRLDDHIGPILLGELHDSGQNSFLVYDGQPDHIVGTLFLRDAVAVKEGGLVRQLMHTRLSFVHEDFSLRQVLRAFAQTTQFIVVVVNSFDEPVGVITLEHLLAQLIDERQDDEFDAFEDRKAVAAFALKRPQPELATQEVAAEDAPPQKVKEMV